MYRERVFDDAVIAEAGRRLSEAAPPSSRVILFGSAARGELTENSDLDFLVIEPEVENPALESVRLRRALGDVLVPMDIIVASEHRVQEWRDVRGSLIHAAMADGRELVG
jgi:predicted nucleotidyltransferase